jgi:hypothetical protein
MKNQPDEITHIKQYLINCFIHPIIANLFNTWDQVKLFESGSTIKEIFSVQLDKTIYPDYE